MSADDDFVPTFAMCWPAEAALRDWLSSIVGRPVPSCPGAVLGECFGCDLPIRIGPNQQQVIARHGYKTLCVFCALALRSPDVRTGQGKRNLTFVVATEDELWT